MPAHLSIGFVARQTGCTVPTIRYYEEIGLLHPSGRSEAGQRQFDERAVRRLTFIRRCRDFGFSIDAVRALVGLVDGPDRPCAEVRDIAAAHLVEVRHRLEELTALQASLSDVVRHCESACAGGVVADCTILDDLALPGPQPRAEPRGGGALLPVLMVGRGRRPGLQPGGLRRRVRPARPQVDAAGAAWRAGSASAGPSRRVFLRWLCAAGQVLWTAHRHGVACDAGTFQRQADQRGQAVGPR